MTNTTGTEKRRPRRTRGQTGFWAFILGFASLPLPAVDIPGLPRDTRLLPDRPGDERQELKEPAPPRPPEAPALEPPAETLEPGDSQLSRQLRVPVKTIKLSGNTVFPREELVAIAAPFAGRVLVSEDLQTLQDALTRHYIEKGYINSGAVIPDQKVEDGVIRLQLVEGRLSEIELSGQNWLRDSYVENRLTAGRDEPLNINELQEQLQILQQDRLIDQLNGELRPGARPGEARLKLDVKEHRPYELGVSFNNRRSPTVGSLRGEVYATAFNLTGFGDSLGFRYGHNEGLDDYSAVYSVPLTARDTRLRLYYDRSDSLVVEKPFESANISADFEGFGVALSHPFYRTPWQQFTGEIRLERRSSQTFWFGRPAGFSAGVRENGKSDITALRFAQEWTDRGANQVLALRSTFSVGIDALGATINRNGDPDGQFFTWLGQFQWLRRLGDSDIQLLVRGDVQVASDPLLPLEKFAVGGAYSVRGYRENILVRDNGAAASVELRVPVFRLPLPWLSERAEDGQVQLAPFFDFGWSEDKLPGSEGSTTLSSVGIGARWDPHRNIHGELYWGYGLRKIDSGATEKDLQDQGIHFNLGIQFL